MIFSLIDVQRYVCVLHLINDIGLVARFDFTRLGVRAALHLRFESYSDLCMHYYVYLKVKYYEKYVYELSGTV